MKDICEMSTVKPTRAKRTLPNLPKSSKPSNGVFLSPTYSPRTSRRNCTNSPLATTGRDQKDKAKQPSRLPITIRRSQSLSELSINAKLTSQDKLRKQAPVDIGGKNSNHNNTRDVKLSTPGESNTTKTIKNTTVKKQTNSLNKQAQNEAKIKKNQELSEPMNHSNPESSNSRALTKSESINSLDSLCGLGLEEEHSCVTVAVRVRPFNQR